MRMSDNEFEDYRKHLDLIRAASRAYYSDDGATALELLPELIGHLTYWRGLAVKGRAR